MVLNKRVIDFKSLSEKIEKARSVKDQYTYHTYLQKFAGRNCEFCELSLNPYGVYQNEEKAVCVQCFNQYLDDEEYLFSLKLFENKVLRVNGLIDAFLVQQDNAHFHIDLANELFKGQSLTEIEQMIGTPKTFGSFDYGTEAGVWRLGNAVFEIWFKNQTCTDVQLV